MDYPVYVKIVCQPYVYEYCGFVFLDSQVYVRTLDLCKDCQDCHTRKCGGRVCVGAVIQKVSRLKRKINQIQTWT